MRLENLDAVGQRLVSPSAERNKGPVADVLKQILPTGGLVLEISSGTGQHAAHFAQEMPHLTWQPSEYDEALLPSIGQWLITEGLANVRAPLRLDVTTQPWPIAAADAVVCLNMIHIAPWAAAQGLVRGAGEIVAPGGMLFLYGPFRRQGHPTAPSNEAFDERLRAENPEWGLRAVEDIAALAEAQGFAAPEIHEMPANNLSVVFRKG